MSDQDIVGGLMMGLLDMGPSSESPQTIWQRVLPNSLCLITAERVVGEKCGAAGKLQLPQPLLKKIHPSCLE